MKTMGGGDDETPHETTVSVKFTISATSEEVTVEDAENPGQTTTETQYTYSIVATYDSAVSEEYQVTLTYGQSSLSGSASSVTVNGTSYAYRIEITSSKTLKISIPTDATNVSISAVIYNSNMGRIVYLGTESGSTEETKVIDSHTFTATGDSGATVDSDKSVVLVGENLTGGDYYLYAAQGNASSGSTVYLCELEITYTI